MKRLDFIKHLRVEGCSLIREGARHSWWGNLNKNTRSSVPRTRKFQIIYAPKFAKTFKFDGCADCCLKSNSIIYAY